MQTRCHLSVLIHEQAKKYGNKRVLIYRDFGDTQWKSVSWKEFSRKVRHVSNALLNIGVKVQENIGVFSQNSLQYLYTDFGAFGIRAVSVPFYATSSEQQIQYMIDDAQVRVLFVGEQEQYDKAFRVFSHCPSLERVIVFDKRVVISPNDKNSIYFDDFLTLGENSPRQSEVEKLYAEANEDDLCNILYTSGTTGDSKGVMLSYGQFHAALKANDEVVPVTDKDRIMNFLPITHIFERGWLFLCLSEGAEIVINTNPKEIQQSMRETHPTCMSSVPRFWEKVYAGVKDKIDRANPVRRKLFMKALAVGRKHNIEYLSRGKRYQKRLDEVTELSSSPVIKVNFRDKTPGWKRFNIVFQTENHIFATHKRRGPYMRLFLNNVSTRPSCSDCAFNNKHSLADLTIADYWGVNKHFPLFDDDKGVTLVLVNTEKGAGLFADCQSELECQQTDFKRGAEYNAALSKKMTPHPSRQLFFAELDHKSLSALANEILGTAEN